MIESRAGLANTSETMGEEAASYSIANTCLSVEAEKRVGSARAEEDTGSNVGQQHQLSTRLTMSSAGIWRAGGWQTGSRRVQMPNTWRRQQVDNK
jgi:hypothetical protein